MGGRDREALGELVQQDVFLSLLDDGTALDYNGFVSKVDAEIWSQGARVTMQEDSLLHDVQGSIALICVVLQPSSPSGEAAPAMPALAVAAKSNGQWHVVGLLPNRGLFPANCDFDVDRPIAGSGLAPA